MKQFTRKQQELMEMAKDLKNKVLKKVTALQIFRGVKKKGKQLIKSSNRVVVFKMEDGQEYITNGYFMVKKGFDKAIDEMLVKFADDVEISEQKMSTFYSGNESDYAMVNGADVRVFETLLTTEKTTMIINGDSKDTYHAYMNSYYYRYFEKKVSKMAINNTVSPVIMFDDNNEFVGCILPVRATKDGKKVFKEMPTFEEYYEGEELLKQWKEYELVKLIEKNTDEHLEEGVVNTIKRKQEFGEYIASELKVIKNMDGYYEVAYELQGLGELYTHIAVFGMNHYGHYDYFLTKADTKRLAERMLEKIQIELAKNNIDNKEVISDLVALSSGTLGTLLRELGFEGEITYTVTDELQKQLVKYCEESNENYECWQDVFCKYKEKLTITKTTNNKTEKVENKMKTLQFKKSDVTKAMEKLGRYLIKEKKYYNEEICCKIFDIFPYACEINVSWEKNIRNEDKNISFIAGVDYVGKAPTKNEMLKIDEHFAKVVSMDGLMFNIYIEEEKIKMSADVMVEYLDKWGNELNHDVVIKEYEVEIPRYVEMKKNMDSINDTVEEFEWTVMNILVNIKEENCIGAVIENKFGKLKIEGLYAGADKGNESMELAEKLAKYYEVEIINANGMDIHDLDEEKVLKQLSELASPEMMIAIADKLNLPPLEKEVSSEPTAEDVAEWQGLTTTKQEVDKNKKYKLEIVNANTFEVVQELYAEDEKILTKLQTKLYSELDMDNYFIKVTILEENLDTVKEIEKRLDDIAKYVKKHSGYSDYTLDNGCILSLSTYKKDTAGITLEIYDSHGMFYMRKVGDKKIHEYIDKTIKAQDVLMYEKYGLDNYINQDIGSVIITTKEMESECNIFGTPIKEVVELLLKENKGFELKLFNDKYIKDKHYVLHRKGEIKNENYYRSDGKQIRKILW